MRIGHKTLALIAALDVRVRAHRAGGLFHNEDGDLSGAQQLALTAVGVAIIAGVLYPLLSGGMSSVVTNMLSRLTGLP
jgi:hypothetical protein